METLHCATSEAGENNQSRAEEVQSSIRAASDQDYKKHGITLKCSKEPATETLHILKLEIQRRNAVANRGYLRLSR